MSGVPGRITPVFRPAQAEKNPPCQLSCPNCGDIRTWIGLIAQREKIGLSADEAYARAWRVITDVNPFPAVLGRVCPHPCESGCNRNTLDEPLAINAMERFLGDWALTQDLPLVRLEEGRRRESIGVVGAGPSGLSFAYQMARRGYRVTVYEGRPRAGGMLRYGIPDYRLPPWILDAEIQRILDLGVTLKLNAHVSREVTLEELRALHDALYLGIGAQKGRGLGLPGEEGSSWWTGTEYLRRVNSGEVIDVGCRVVVVGGGNTAIDAARTARRHGADVTILYRRSRTEMPAIAQEIDDALEEGVTLLLQVAPVRIERDGEALRSVVACRMELGPPDESGRRRPIVIPDSEFVVPADSVIAAVSQEPDTVGFETVALEAARLSADAGGAEDQGIWTGGDVLGLGIAAQAIVAGRFAAEALHSRLRGIPLPARLPTVHRSIGPEEILADFHGLKPAAHPHRLPPAARIKSPVAEVTSALAEEAFLDEASRCMSCGSCFGCEQCAMYCTKDCFTRLDEVSPGAYFSVSLSECEECGKCVSVCPSGYLELAPVSQAIRSGE